MQRKRLKHKYIKTFDCDLLSAKEEVMLFFMSILSLIGLSVVVATIIKIILRW